MGRIRPFFRLYRRKRLDRVSFPQAAGGPHKGIECANVPHELFVACTGEQGFDVVMYQALHTSIDAEGLFDILEMRQVADTWKAAAIANMKAD